MRLQKLLNYYLSIYYHVSSVWATLTLRICYRPVWPLNGKSPRTPLTNDDPYANIRKTNNQTKDWALVTSQVYEGSKFSIYHVIYVCVCILSGAGNLPLWGKNISKQNWTSTFYANPVIIYLWVEAVSITHFAPHPQSPLRQGTYVKCRLPCVCERERKEEYSLSPSSSSSSSCQEVIVGS